MDNKEKKLIRKIGHRALEVVGVLCIVLGIIGLVLPIVPQIPFLIAGILILGEESIYTGWIFKILPKKMSIALRKGLAKARKKLKIPDIDKTEE